jgi:hypothetical protein
MRLGVIADRRVSNGRFAADPDGERLPNPATASYGYPSDDQTIDDKEGSQ